MARIYQADVWCDDCGHAIENRIRAEGKAPEDFMDEGSYDSDDFPKYMDDDEEADLPQHCAGGAECLSATVIGGASYGCFLGNSLTAEGAQYVRAEFERDPDNPVARFWADHYGLLCGDECGRIEGHPCATCGGYVKPYDCAGKAGTHYDSDDCAETRS